MDKNKCENDPLFDPYISESECDEVHVQDASRESKRMMVVSMDDGERCSSTMIIYMLLITTLFTAVSVYFIADYHQSNPPPASFPTNTGPINNTVSDNGTAVTKLPGVDHMQKVYNMLRGKQIVDMGLVGEDIIDYQYTRIDDPNRRVDVDDVEFYIPDEWRNVPDVSPSCETNTETNSVYSSTSTSVLDEQFKSASGGYQQTVDWTLGATYEDISASASTSYTNALLHGHSSTSIKGVEHAEESYQWSFSVHGLVEWYTAEIDWQYGSSQFQFKEDFMKTLDDLKANPSNKAILSFINRWGTHVMTQMRTGAKCQETAYVSSQSSLDHVYEFKDDVSSDTIGFLFWSETTEKQATHKKEDTTESNVKYSFDDNACYGEVEVTNDCGGFTGTQNNPSVVSHVLYSVFDIPAVKNRLGEVAYEAITNFFESLYQAFQECSDAICNLHGTCRMSESIWDNIDKWDGMDFKHLTNYYEIYDGVDYCFCYPERTGQWCQYGVECTADNHCPEGYACPENTVITIDDQEHTWTYSGVCLPEGASICTDGDNFGDRPCPIGYTCGLQVIFPDNIWDVCCKDDPNTEDDYILECE